MEFALFLFVLASFALHSCHISNEEWDRLVVVRENSSTILQCNGTKLRGDKSITWMVKSSDAEEWKLILSASEKTTFSGGASKPSMRLTDSNFQDTGVFSLFVSTTAKDGGLYSCLIKQQERKLKEKVFLLAILTVSFYPPSPVPQHSTLRMIAGLTPDIPGSSITWMAPGGLPMKTEKKTRTVAKLPQVQNSDEGTYVCMVHSYNTAVELAVRVDVKVDADKVASFTNITHGPMISTAIQAHKPFLLTCPTVQGDYVLLHWLPPDAKQQSSMRLVYQYDRWRGSVLQSEQSRKLNLAGLPHRPEAGSFAFQLRPELKDGGLYICEVSLNDVLFSQRTMLSVLKVKSSLHSSKEELMCLYSERSQVQSVEWKHAGKRRLQMWSHAPGSLGIALPRPISSDLAGNYTCSLQLKNGQVINAVQVVTVPPAEIDTVTPSMPLSLFALLLLVPLVAAAVGVLLWRQKHISDRGIEQSLSVHSGEVENVYENPESMRQQAPPQGSVYMDLKPRGDNDVYKELERCEQCQG